MKLRLHTALPARGNFLSLRGSLLPLHGSLLPLRGRIWPLRESVLPLRGSGARLPFLLVPVLAGMAALQVASPQRIDLPPGGAVARVGLAALPDAPLTVIVPPVLAARDLFAPSAKAGGAAGPADPLNGAVIAGVVQQGQRRVGIVQEAGGKLRYVAVGGAIAGWRLIALNQAGARLTHGPGQNLLVTYGTHAAPPTASSTPAKTEDGQ